MLASEADLGLLQHPRWGALTIIAKALHLGCCGSPRSVSGLEMTISLQVRILILSREVGYLVWVRINSAKSCEWQLFAVILQTSHNQILIGLKFSKNVFRWETFKTCSCDIFFSWTFHLFLIMSIMYGRY